MTYHVLSLGAGVQSTTLYLMFMRGELGVNLDAAIFADTQEEPRAVYEHLEWLKSLGGPPILTGTAGKLGDDLMAGRNSTGQRFASIPAFTRDAAGAVGKLKRQCSKEYKTEVIGKVLRQQILGLKPKRSPNRSTKVYMHIGISLDEAGRAVRLERNNKPPKYLTRVFDLIDRLITRTNCKAYLADKVPHETPRSACTFCPFHDDYEWDQLKRGDREGWDRARQVDASLRVKGAVLNRNLKQEMFVHRDCKPIDLVQLNPAPPGSPLVQLPMNFAAECEGMCGL